jgi:tRNA G18 (ribose-2'-O)-methylase SpoU
VSVRITSVLKDVSLPIDSMNILKSKTSAPNFAADSTRHQEAIALGHDFHYSYLYNVVDKFKSKTTEEIRETLRETAFPFAVCFENFVGSFTLASGMRTANAFNANEVFYIGVKKFDKRGLVGVHNYTRIQWLSTVNDLLALKDRYVFVGADNVPNAKPLHNYTWAPNSMMIFGTESVGLTPRMLEMCKDVVYIQQYGSVRSINASVASGIFMNDFVIKFKGG